MGIVYLSNQSVLFCDAAEFNESRQSFLINLSKHQQEIAVLDTLFGHLSRIKTTYLKLDKTKEAQKLNGIFIQKRLYIRALKPLLNAKHIQYEENSKEFTFDSHYEQADKLFYHPDKNSFHRKFGNRLVFAQDISFEYRKKSQKLFLTFDIKQTEINSL